MARTKKAATKTTVKTASVSETPAKSVVTTSEEKAAQAETAKTDNAKASVETKAAEKTTETKAETKPAEEKTAAAKKTTARKTTTAKKTTKTAAKTTTRKTTAAKKAEKVTEVYVQYWGKEIHTSEVAEQIKKIWTDDMGKKASDLKDLKIYIKPEDNGAHYVINGDITGFIGL